MRMQEEQPFYYYYPAHIKTPLALTPRALIEFTKSVPEAKRNIVGFDELPHSTKLTTACGKSQVVIQKDRTLLEVRRAEVTFTDIQKVQGHIPEQWNTLEEWMVAVGVNRVYEEPTLRRVLPPLDGSLTPPATPVAPTVPQAPLAPEKPAEPSELPTPIGVPEMTLEPRKLFEDYPSPTSKDIVNKMIQEVRIQLLRELPSQIDDCIKGFVEKMNLD